jgi:formylglycine-generating enzyme
MGNRTSSGLGERFRVFIKGSRTKRVTVLGGGALVASLVARDNQACPSQLMEERTAASATAPSTDATPETAEAATASAPAPPATLAVVLTASAAPPGAATDTTVETGKKADPGRPAAPSPAAAPVRQNPFGAVLPAASEADAMSETLDVQREKLLSHMQSELALSPPQLARVREVFAASSILSQGNPRISLHPIGRAECRAALADRPLRPGDDSCGAPHMAALYDRAEDGPESARACIDQFEFPNIPCEYPVVHVSAREAAKLCEAVGKRLCDAHEWEGACAGSLDPPEREYAWGKDRQAMRRLHNAARTRVWAYGPEKNHALCATTSYKTPGCPGGGFGSCGSNTFPAGAFPDCVSPFGVYDQHGNAAEHMSLPLRREEMTSAGSAGATEMKGSWFIFSHYEAHEDDCHWRAPDWHPSSVMSTHSHGNYHLGFRCCKTLAAEPSVASATATAE